MPAELKILVVHPSIRSWPILLGIGILVILTGVLGLVLLFFPAGSALPVVALGVAFTVWPALASANTEYWVTNRRVVVSGGVLRKSERELPVAQIREVRVSRTPLQKTLGIGDISVVGSGGELLLTGVEEPEAFRERILSVR